MADINELATEHARQVAALKAKLTALDKKFTPQHNLYITFSLQREVNLRDDLHVWMRKMVASQRLFMKKRDKRCALIIYYVSSSDRSKCN